MTRRQLFAAIGAAAIGIAAALLVVGLAAELNGGHGFPLDDPWIHLQFAKNLQEYGSFSYYRNEMATAGSTSPLYTLILAAGFFVTSNEFVLSYTLGIAALALAGYFFFRLTREGEGLLLPLGGTLLFLLESRMQWAALSGMETTLFIALLLASVSFYRERRVILLGVAGGLSLWARPEGVLMASIVGVDFLYERWRVRGRAGGPGTVITRALPVLFVLWGLYALMNILLSGSLLPNTYSAKLTYYAGGGGQFLPQLQIFLVGDHMPGVVALAGFGIVRLVRDLMRRDAAPGLIPLLWTLAMVAVYWWKLPFLFQQGRYLMPVLPFLLLLALQGLSFVVTGVAQLVNGRRLVEHIVTGAVLAALLVLFGIRTAGSAKEYTEVCKYINDRQVRTALWIKEHLPANAIVATHDIGAIGFYSERRIYDMVGLVTPGAIRAIGNLTEMERLMVAAKVTHIAVLRNWFEVDNISPLFQTDVRYPEIMEVFEYRPAETFFIPGNVGLAMVRAVGVMKEGNVRLAEAFLSRFWPEARQSARYATVLGQVRLVAGDTKGAREAFAHALSLFPGSPDGVIGMADIEVREGKAEAAFQRLEEFTRQHRANATVFRMMGVLATDVLRDTTLGDRWKNRAAELEP